MMPKVARRGDDCFGVCSDPSHSSPISIDGKILTGSSTLVIEQRPVARIKDYVMSSCGHIGVIIKGSSTTVIDQMPVARVGDTFDGVYSGYISGSSSTLDVG
jgi:uncharacterized Zn-binding protein involved in type VI secretion